ncbi:NAD-binding protein [bacterium]|nr:NAD-binding protein [bacterium]
MSREITHRFREFQSEIQQMLDGFREARIARIFIIILILMIAGGMTLWAIEGRKTFATPFDAFWWALVTMTTVGYGDITPHGVSGRIAAMVLMILGMSIVSLFTASVSSVLVAIKIREGKGLRDISYINHLVICGWHDGGEEVISSLKSLSKEKMKLVLINDLSSGKSEELLERFKDLNPKFVRGDYHLDSILRRAAVDKAAAVLILPEIKDDLAASHVDQHTILAALAIKEINPRVKVYAHALDRNSVPHMRRGGVDRVVLRDAHIGFLLAAHALAPGIPEVVDELLTYESNNRIERVTMPKELVGKTFRDAQLWAVHELDGMLIGLVSEEQVLGVTDILSDDISSIDQFIMKKFEEAGRSAEELASTQITINPSPERQIGPRDVAVVIRRVGE